ncbi:MAG: hypothetical protein IPK70_00400 [Flavobacteriales bacterium]|nr:hypothetical protein [Flavobacteriales bacterium]
MSKQKSSRVSKDQLSIFFDQDPKPQLMVDASAGTVLANDRTEVVQPATSVWGMNRFDFKWAVLNASPRAFRRHLVLLVLGLLSTLVGAISSLWHLNSE